MASTKDMSVYLGVRPVPGGLLCRAQAKGIGRGRSIWSRKLRRRPGAGRDPKPQGEVMVKYSVTGTASHGEDNAVWVPAFAGTTAWMVYGKALHRCGGHAAVDHDGLPGHEGRGIRGEISHRARDLVGLADPPQRRGGAAVFQALLVLPQRAGEIGLDQARRDAVDADALRAPFAGEAAAQREIGSLGDAVGADHGRAAHAADGGDDDDRAL